MCDRAKIAEFGVALHGVDGVPDGVALRVGVHAGQIQLVAVDMVRGDRPYQTLLIDTTELNQALSHLLRKAA